MSEGYLNTREDADHAEVAPTRCGAMIASNHARLASVDSGLHAHFGGFFFFGARA